MSRANKRNAPPQSSTKPRPPSNPSPVSQNGRLHSIGVAIAPMMIYPRIRLRTIFLLVFCISIGLAVTRSVPGAIEPTVTTVLIIGLAQQIRALWRYRPDASQFDFARRFSIAWRATVFLTLTFQLVDSFTNWSTTLIASSLGESLNGTQWLVFLSAPHFICILVVLCSSIERWRLPPPTNSIPAQLQRLKYLLAVPLALLIVLGATQMTFFVHKGLAGIEAGQPASLRRPGAYLSAPSETLPAFSFAIAAVLSLIIAGSILLRAVRRADNTSIPLRTLLAATLLLIVPCAFCAWFYVIRFPIASPDMAEAGLDTNWLDLLLGGMIGLPIAIVGADKISQSTDTRPIQSDMAQTLDTTAFHETAPCLLLIALQSFYLLYVIASCCLDFTSGSPIGPTFYQGLVSMFSNPTILLFLAQAVAGLQLCWVRWRRRSDTVDWQLHGLSRPRFYRSVFAIAILLIIGVPTLNAFALASWMGPWKLLTLFGY
jgi:hypothetical protein